VPQLSVHRGKLQLALLDALRARLGDGAVRTGCALTSFGPVADGRVRARFGDFEETGDVLVGADGIHSAVRRHFQPHEGPPRWSGNVLWRATSRAAPFLSGRSMFMAGSRRVKFVAYPISGVEDDGKCVINWIAELDRSGEPLAEREDWNRRGALADFLPAFEGWRSLARRARADPRRRRGVRVPDGRPRPLPAWTHGRVTLLGDAAHPMYPIGSNGASQAILDARALADALAAEADVERALARYEDERRPATARIVLSNREHGPERVLDLAEERAPDGFARVEDVFAPGELESIAARYKQVAGFARPQPS
jgi:2-polyprenyl-6-methoxyphenol hydroxylase-like FAD-dependent oxidoreductase